MVERFYTRIDTIRQYVDTLLKSCDNQEICRNGYVHLYGVGQAAAFIAMYRGHYRKYAELAEVAGMLHDISKYTDKIEENHEQRSSEQAKQILEDSKAFTNEEINLISKAIRAHRNKDCMDDEFDEILKDADELQHYLRNPREEYYFIKDRTQKLIQEFRLENES